MKGFIQYLRNQQFRRLFKNEETRFIILVGLKVSGISLAVNLSVYYFLYQVIRLNFAFFDAQGFPMKDEVIFFDYIIRENIENLPVLFAFHIFIFFIGTYVGWLILRPFRVIGEYAEAAITNPNTVYRTDEFSNYRLLTRFSEFFFEFLRESRKKEELTAHSIPPQYSRIHKPVLDLVFLFHFGILFIIIAACSAVFIIDNSGTLYNEMTDLALRTLQNPVAVRKFFQNQSFILDEVVFMTLSLIFLFYSFLAFHLYGMVAGAAFGIFSTMRAYMKGNYFSRVHLVGYAYIREYTRKLNKYLDHMENKFSRSKTGG